MKSVLVYLCILATINSFSRDLEFIKDSVQKEIDKYQDYDTNKLNLYFFLADVIADEAQQEQIQILEETYRQAKFGKHFDHLFKACQELGYAHFYSGDYDLSEKYLWEGIDVAQKHKDNRSLAIGLSDLGQVEDALEKDSLSVEHTLEAVRMFEELKDYKELVGAYNNLAGIYYYRGGIEKALEYYEKAKDILIGHLSLRENYQNWAITESNIGWCYYYQDDLPAAIEQLKRAVDIHSKYDYYSPASGYARSNLASIYVETKEFEKARMHAQDALDICIELDYDAGIGDSYAVLGEIAMAEKNYRNAATNFVKALEFAKLSGDLYDQEMRADYLAESYSNIGNFQKAYVYITLSKTLSDSLRELESNAAFEDAFTKYETEKKEAENALLQKESELKDVQMTKERLETKNEKERNFLVGGGIALILLTGLFFVINRNRLKTKTNKQLALQRDEIMEQKKEITDSITYAKNIQNSFLPQDKDFEPHFTESFLMYQPKDIVAGDFYILEEVGDYIFFSVADCTGHGVPGAMVSIVCSNAIRKVLHEMDEYDPGMILNHTRDIVISQFERKGHTVNDGMDISFCRLDKKNMKLSWAGANNDLLVVRKGADSMLEIKPNKQPIGGYVTSDPFTTHEIEIEKGDCIYLTSDGYPDQFGGEKGKKYKYKRFKELLLSGSSLKMADQKAKITSEFWEWKQGFEQIDDVCVLGVRI